MVGILVSFWEGPFSGAMLVSGRVLDIVSDVNQAPENYISEMLCKNFCANKKRLQTCCKVLCSVSLILPCLDFM